MTRSDDLDGLDPSDWPAVRAQAHAMLDDILDYVQHIRRRPVWTRMPDDLRGARREETPRAGQPLPEVHAEFMAQILPFGSGNVHPRFMGWVQGGGNVFGMLGEMLASGLNANVGGRDHAPIEIERRVVRWAADAFGFPETAGGLLLNGASMANFVAVLTARVAAEGPSVRSEGVRGRGLVAYASVATHGCVSRAMDMAGLGTAALRLVEVDAAGRIDLEGLTAAIAGDRAARRRPFLVIGNAGTVDIGAIDDLSSLGALCRRENLWFHVDGAIGALGALSPLLRPLLAGLESADSVAFDFHKWGQVPYDAGCIVVRDEAAQRRAFAAEADYLRRQTRGLAAGETWPCDLGPDLSRGFRALKVWYTWKTLGSERLGAAMAHTCALARHLAARVDREPELERMAPVPLNIVCFRYRFARDADRANADLVVELQESGVAAPSTTTLGGKTVIRCAIVNHRTRLDDIDALVDATLLRGRRASALPVGE